MNLLNKLKKTIVFSLTFTALFSTCAYAEDTIFSQITEGTQLLAIDTAPVVNSNPNIYVTTKASVDMKAGPSNDSDLIELLTPDYNLTLLGAENGWVYVCNDEGEKGYVYATNIDFKNGEKPANTDPLDLKRQEIADLSKKYIGTPYVWGGTSLTSGVDCSGFVYCLYKNYGITLTRNSAGMYANNGISVSKDELKPGDLLFFNTGGSGVSHVGMYIGNGEYIHAASVDVKISNLYDSYSTRTYVGAKRIFI